MIKPLARFLGGVGMVGGGSLLRSYAEDNNDAKGSSVLGAAGLLMQLKGGQSFARATTGLLKGKTGFWKTADRMVGFGSTRNILKGVGKGIGAVGNMPINAVTGAGEYARLSYRTMRAKGYRNSWSAFIGGLGSMNHPFMPAVAGGLALGGASAFASRFTPAENSDWGSLKNWNYDPLRTPTTPGFTANAAFGPINYENFGGGVRIGRSAVRSQTVMEGQLAVTDKMLKARRL